MRRHGKNVSSFVLIVAFDLETVSEGLSECDEICYKDPVLKDQKWSAYIDRSPGAANYSQECFNACVAGCGYKFEICKEIVSQVRPRPPPPSRQVVKPPPATTPDEREEDVPSTSA
ncbi:hypothetical protein V6N11_047699 [Hibiscus sabdariffa]|uniref:Defensin-like protein n=1 Tax=Hibiscus sabdariffa TaxID=183260 RepID=A0ABR2P7S7_9ROSI